MLDFDPATDGLDFGWFSSDNFTITEENGSVVISIPSNSQTYTLEGVSLDDLSMDNITAKDASALAAWQSALDAGNTDNGGDTGDTGDSGNTDNGGDTGDTGDTGDGGDTGNTGDTDTGTTTAVTWAWGSHAVIDFNPATDVLDLGWLSADNFSVAEQNGSVVITIAGNDQTYTLEGVTLAEMSMDDISARDASALAEWQALLDAADAQAATTTATAVTDPLHASDGLV